MTGGVPSGRRHLEHALGSTELSSARLDALLDEMVGRVGEVVTDQERLRTLLAAVVGLGTDLDLRRVLRRITRAACLLANAHYAALGVLSPDGTALTEVIFHGVTDEERARTEPASGRHSIRGLLIAEPQPIRLPHLGDHAFSYRLPPNHRPTGSFLGVPIRVRDRVYGNLYLSKKVDADDFTEQDQRLVESLATAAAVAIDNAARYALIERQGQWLQATTEIAQLLVGRVDRAEAMRLIAGKTRQVSGCDVAAVLLDDDTGGLVVEVAEGPQMSSIEGMRIPTEEAGILAEVFGRGSPVVVDDLAKEAHAGRTHLTGPAIRNLAHTVLAPLRTSAGAVGVVLASNRRETPTPLDDVTVELIASFANHVAITLERLDAQADRAQVAVLAERNRIAQDMHDMVIQRLFAAGLQLQVMLRLAEQPQLQERIHTMTDDLDETIREVRSTIFELASRPAHDGGLPAEIRRLADDYTSPLGFAPRTTFRGPVASAVPRQVGSQVLAVIREALSNAARHAQATVVIIAVEAQDGAIKVTVSDDGTGVGQPRRDSGLRNLRARATALHGRLELRPNQPSGTVLEWSVPIKPNT